jgi:putative (di)nucleoside polyphosphate hydrolase
MSQNQYFRVGVGIVLYNEDKEIYIFRRSDLPNVWQFPQGGMDAGETPLETLWRELEEETGLTEDDISEVTPFPNFLLYEYSPELRSSLKDPNCAGQLHHWFFLEIMPGTNLDLNLAKDDEFIDYKITDFDELLELGDDMKQHVYEELAEYFINEL